jgi:hypothetical protein
MTRPFMALPVAALLALSLSACGRDEPELTASNPELPSRADAPVNPDRPAAGTMLHPDTSDPSIPQDPSNTTPAKKDRSAPYDSGEPAQAKPEG